MAEGLACDDHDDDNDDDDDEMLVAVIVAMMMISAPSLKNMHAGAFRAHFDKDARRREQHACNIVNVVTRLLLWNERGLRRQNSPKQNRNVFILFKLLIETPPCLPLPAASVSSFPGRCCNVFVSTSLLQASSAATSAQHTLKLD